MLEKELEKYWKIDDKSYQQDFKPGTILHTCQFLMKMRLDCVRIQSHQFIHGTSVPKYLLLICKNFVYDAYCHRIKTIIKGSFQNPITYIKRWLHIQEAI